MFLVSDIFGSVKEKKNKKELFTHEEHPWVLASLSRI
jgi:hypothetical protein